MKQLFLHPKKRALPEDYQKTPALQRADHAAAAVRPRRREKKKRKEKPIEPAQKNCCPSLCAEGQPLQKPRGSNFMAKRNARAKKSKDKGGTAFDKGINRRLARPDACFARTYHDGDRTALAPGRE